MSLLETGHCSPLAADGRMKIIATFSRKIIVWLSIARTTFKSRYDFGRHSI